MSFWTLDNVKSVIAGTWLARPEGLARRIEAAETPFGGAAIDSRAVRPGNIFFALKGEKTDGHKFVSQAAAAGATLVLVDDAEALAEPGSSMPQSSAPQGQNALGPNAAMLRVPDVSAALLRLATAYRRTLETTRVIAVGGSNGKTTTTRIIQTLLSRTLRGSASPKSFNNAIGVPLTILNAKRGDNYLVCEVGTNAPGEIAVLAAAVQPDIAVITSIGREHLEGLASLSGVAREEASLLTTLRPGGVAIVNADSPELAQALESVANVSSRGMPTAAGATGAVNAGERRSGVVRFGVSNDADIRVTEIVELPLSAGGGVRFCLNGRTWHSIPLLGRVNALNAAAAVGVARRLGLSDAEIDAGLAAVAPAEMRMQRSRVDVPGGAIEVINDAYNANPDSMLAAIGVFAQLGRERTPGAGAVAGAGAGVEGAGAGGAGRRVVVLGDMLELGEHSAKLHREIGEALAAQHAADVAILVGDTMEHAAAGIGAAHSAIRVERLATLDGTGAARVAAMLAPGDLVLLKGSRRMRLERVIGHLTGIDGPASANAAAGVPTPN
jgi:UDP-N-acetylmuramoyl-tripeptide--D-alanyl-D-alanine ligase